MDQKDVERFFPFGDGEDAVSASECTGLIPALPQNDAEAANAAALYAIHRAKRVGKSKRGQDGHCAD